MGIQALVNVSELRSYFLDKQFEADINLKNPLGMQGRMAVVFSDLMDVLWKGIDSSHAPQKLRRLIGMKEPRFNDFMQHDAQEFMAFLLDALHEDLNRVKNKPYYEIEENEDEDDSVVADKSWELHKSRNNSKIVDLFHGLFKNRLVCPHCGKTSIKFDPFLFLPLPIPKSTRSLYVIFHPSDISQPKLRICVRISKDCATAREVFQQVHAQTRVPLKQLRVFEVSNNRIHRFFIPSSSLDNVSDNSKIFVQEAPNDASDTYEIAVMQRTQLAEDPMSCTYCGTTVCEVTNERKAIKRCLKCLKAGYCDQDCQKADWQSHRTQCSKTYNKIGMPFIAYVKRSEATYANLCRKLIAIASDTVNVTYYKNVGGGQLTPQLSHQMKTSL